jgi:cytochrome P450
MPRKVIAPFTFADGTNVPLNNWIVIPQHALMRDTANYDDPNTFHGFRFANPNAAGIVDPASSRFSTPSFNFPFWGGTKRPWYVGGGFQRIIWLQ